MKFMAFSIKILMKLRHAQELSRSEYRKLKRLKAKKNEMIDYIKKFDLII